MAIHDQNYFDICNAVLGFEVRKGHLKWTITDVARESGITRSLIYYYFGKDKKTILNEASGYIIEVFFDITSIGKNGITLAERMKDILKNIESMPYLIPLFYLQKCAAGPVGEKIKEAEEKLIAAIVKHNPEKTWQEAKIIYLMELGAVLYRMPPSECEEVFKGLI